MNWCLIAIVLGFILLQVDAEISWKGLFQHFHDKEESISDSQVHQQRIQELLQRVKDGSEGASSSDQSMAIRESVSTLSEDQKTELIVQLTDALMAALVVPDTDPTTETQSNPEDIRLQRNSSRKLQDQVVEESDFVQKVHRLSRSIRLENENKHQRLYENKKFVSIIQAARQEAQKDLTVVNIKNGTHRRLEPLYTVSSIALLVICVVFDIVWNRVVNEKWRVGALTAAAVSGIIFNGLTVLLGKSVLGSYRSIKGLPIWKWRLPTPRKLLAANDTEISLEKWTQHSFHHYSTEPMGNIVCESQKCTLQN